VMIVTAVGRFWAVAGAHGGDHPAAIKLAQEGKIDLEHFITGRIPLEDLVDKGFNTLTNHNDTAVKITVYP
jgi:(R,R)-butanediol dehydrogenase/meso-butanediol dehydrogenase/diacetyl reductase